MLTVMTNAQAALIAAASATPQSRQGEIFLDPDNGIIKRADRFLKWLDQADAAVEENLVQGAVDHLRAES